MRNNFHPSMWGESQWEFMHMVALSYPPKPTASNKRTYKSYFINLGKVLPCDVCRKNFNNHMTKTLRIDAYLSNPNRLFKWTIMLRNAVQKQNGQKKRYKVGQVRNSLLKEGFSPKKKLGRRT